MSGTTDALMGGQEDSIEALGRIWGGRIAARRTRGDHRRTLCLAALHILEKEAGMQECGDLARFLADAWAGEDGWDTAMLIKALGATKGQPYQPPEKRIIGRKEDA